MIRASRTDPAIALRSEVLFATGKVAEACKEDLLEILRGKRQEDTENILPQEYEHG